MKCECGKYAPRVIPKHSGYEWIQSLSGHWFKTVRKRPLGMEVCGNCGRLPPKAK